MEVSLDTLREVRQVSQAAARLCKLRAVRQGHDHLSCACAACKGYRWLTLVAHELGKLEPPELEEDVS